MVMTAVAMIMLMMWVTTAEVVAFTNCRGAPSALHAPQASGKGNEDAEHSAAEEADQRSMVLMAPCV